MVGFITQNHSNRFPSLEISVIQPTQGDPNKKVHNLCTFPYLSSLLSAFMFAVATATPAGSESNIVDPTAGLAHPLVRSADVHQRRTVRDPAHARLQHLDPADQVRPAEGPRYLRVSGKSIRET